jgi:hypothetical protein
MYEPRKDEWRLLPDTPSTIGWGGGLAVASGVLYALHGSDTEDFWRYPLADQSP